MNKLHALIIGIDRYAGDVSILNGCVADQEAWCSFLRSHFAEEVLSMQTLSNENATREAIITAFRKHLVEQAAPGDLVLFVYSGHGSREPAPAEFSRYFAEQLMETTVCYDSRMPGGQDIADKEWNTLLQELPRGCHIRMVFDACHSGSITRNKEEHYREGMLPRTYSPRREPRALTELLGYEKGVLRSYSSPAHVALAACNRQEVAWEQEGQGLFTRSLLGVLHAQGPNILLGELGQLTNREMQKHTQRQHPQLERIGKVSSTLPFLGLGEFSTRALFLPVYADGQDWYVNLGQWHAWRTGDQQDIYHDQDKQTPIGKLTVTQVGLQKSKVELPPPITGKEPLWVKSQLGEPLVIGIDEQAVAHLSGLTQYSSNTVFTAAKNTGSPWLLSHDEGEWCLTDREADFVLSRVQTSSDQVLAFLGPTFARMAHYQHIQQLDNPQPPVWSDKIGFAFGRVDDAQRIHWLVGEEHRLHFTPDRQGQYPRVPFRLKAWNNSPQPLFFAVFLLAPDFGVYRLFADAAPVPPGTQEVRVLEQEEEAELMVMENSPATVRDEFLLLASTQPIDTAPLEGEGITAYGQLLTERPKRGVRVKPKSQYTWPEEWVTLRIGVQLIR